MVTMGFLCILISRLALSNLKVRIMEELTAADHTCTGYGIGTYVHKLVYLCW